MTEPLLDNLIEIIQQEEELPVNLISLVGRALLAEKFNNIQWLFEDDGDD